ncbi:MAG: DUF4835 family protein [Bacteroidota bacterium]
MKLLPTWIASLCLFLCTSAWAQELNCIVVINADNVPAVDQRIKDEMQTTFAQFINDQVWTEDRFEPQERINCIINLTLQEVTNQTIFRGTAQIQASRPTFGTNYETLLLRYFDQGWEFEYNSGQIMNFNRNAFTNDITGLLSFFAYVILALDYDSFSPLGGDEYWQETFNIANLAQGVGRASWDQFSNNGRNRYQFSNLYANGQMDEIRESWYTYHLEGMDNFLDKDEEARQSILSAIEVWQTVNRNRPNTIVNQVIMDTKSDELVQVFTQGDRQVRQQAYNTLTQLDPTRTTEYEQILEQ